MPTYTYKCYQCLETRDHKHSMHDRIESCPQCGSVYHRVFGKVGISFKGSGFYSTDSKGK